MRRMGEKYHEFNSKVNNFCSRKDKTPAEVSSTNRYHSAFSFNRHPKGFIFLIFYPFILTENCTLNYDAADGKHFLI